MLIRGDARWIPLGDETVQCVVTSPPYWGLRKYGVEGELGLEKTPEEYIENMMAVFREVKRVLRKDGTVWLNLGDSYAAQGVSGRDIGYAERTGKGEIVRHNRVKTLPPGLKPKDLCGMPWRVAFALQADGWWLRSDIIWAKPNPMPESVRDRPTRSHEYLFLFTKGQWVSRVIKLANLPGERIHFFKDFGLRPAETPNPFAPLGINHSATVELCVRLAATVFDGAQRQEDFGLPPFYSEIWQQGANGNDGLLVGELPPPHAAATIAARFLMGEASTKEFLAQLKGLGVTLGSGNNLLIGRVATEFPYSPPLYADGKGTIAIQHASKICKFDFLHDQIITQYPSKCKYYYDAVAIREPSSGLPGGRFGSYPDGTMRHDANRPRPEDNGGRNKRDVWFIATQPWKGAHFATFPEKLVEPCILAGSKPSDIVLDPFVGSGTVVKVARQHSRIGIGIDLKREYLVEQASKRIARVQLELVGS